MLNWIWTPFLKEANMNAYELLLSESQERMLIVAEKGKEQVVLDIFENGAWMRPCAGP